MATRANGRYHVGIDLWGEAGDFIVACEDGTVVNHYHFYNNVHALIVQCDSGLVINYGEVEADSWKKFGLDTGSRVKGGQPIALVGRMVNDSMCHFETYRKGTKQNYRYYVGKQPPSALLNPTKYLLHLAALDYPSGPRRAIQSPFCLRHPRRPQSRLSTLFPGRRNHPFLIMSICRASRVSIGFTRPFRVAHDGV